MKKVFRITMICAFIFAGTEYFWYNGNVIRKEKQKVAVKKRGNSLIIADRE